MKRMISILLSLCLLAFSVVAQAEQEKNTNVEELLTERDELITKLSEINAAYGSAIKEQQLSEENVGSQENLGAISSLFPDETFAMFIRDKLNKFSISQPVSQAELDTITDVNGNGFSNYPIADLTGISYLRFVNTIDVGWQHKCLIIPDEVCQLKYLKKIDMDYSGITSLPEDIGNVTTLQSITAQESKITKLPDSFTKLVDLRTFNFYNSQLTSLPEDMGCLISLKSINITYCKINKLPDSICELIGLTELYAGNTDITSLPANIGNLVNLKNLDISNTGISVLPESIWGLQLNNLNMSGTSIK